MAGTSESATFQESTPSVERTIREVGESLQDGLLPAAVFDNEELFDVEQERVFKRSWVFIGHESEIPSPGDYTTRYIGQDPFIFVRDEEGQIRVLFASCRHQGAKLCSAEAGNTSHFRCPYHGWTYENTGDLAGVPQKDSAFGGLDPEEWGLLEPPNVEAYEGLVFVSLSEESPSLADYLGEYTWYLDIQTKLADGGMEVLGDPHRFVVETDWKHAADNFAGDSYHTQITHKSAIDLRFAAEEISGAPGGEHQHITHCGVGSASLRLLPAEHELFLGYPEDYLTDEALTADQYRVVKRSGVNVGIVFPNLGFAHVAYSAGPDRSLRGYLTLRKFRPVAPSKFEFLSWVLVPSQASDEYREDIRKISTNTLGPSGNLEQDDVIVWEGIGETAGASFAKDKDMKLNYQMGMAGMSDAEIDDEWPGPGTAWDTNLEDGVKRTFHYNWYKAMAGEPIGVEYGDDVR